MSFGHRSTLRSWVMLAPAVLPVGVMSAVAMADAIATSLGRGIDASGAGIDFSAYRALFDNSGFWEAYRFSVWVSVAGTVIAVAAASALGFAAICRPGLLDGRRLTALNLNVALPHLVWAVALAALLAPSGWLARIAAAAGLIDRPDQFPVVVNDSLGLGIILHIATKELPFLVLACLPLSGRRLRTKLRQAATLGAGPSAQFRHVYLPGVAPALVPATMAVLAFALGSYEPAAVLGVQRPRTLAVVALERFRDPDLARRAEAFALTNVLLVTVVLVGALVLIVARRSWARP